METIKFANYGEKRERIATESELEIYVLLCNMTGRDDFDLVRKSDNYVSMVLGDWDIARIKFTPRAKWVLFPIVESASSKHKITAPTDVSEFADLLADSIAHVEKYSN